MIVALKRTSAALLILLLAVLAGCGGGGGGAVAPQVVGVSGIVRNAATGEGIAGASVTLTPQTTTASDRAPMTTTTDTDGRYAFRNVPTGEARVNIQTADTSYRSTFTDVNIQPGTCLPLSFTLLSQSESVTTNLRLTPQSATVAVGDILQFEPNATQWDYIPYYTVVGDIGFVSTEGIFIATKPGVGEVRAWLGGSVSRAEVTVTGASTQGTLMGVIVDPNGLPVQGAQIISADKFQRYSGPDGIYVIPRLPPGVYTMVVQRTGYDDRTITTSVQAGKANVLSIIMDPNNLAGLSVTPSSVTLGPGDSQRFSVTANGFAYPAVTWSVVEGESGGQISEYGYYVAPNAAGTYHVAATSISDPKQKVAATVTVKSGSGTVIIR